MMYEGLCDYQNLWRLDVLGVTGIVYGDIAVQQDFRNQLIRRKIRWYETTLMWKDSSTSLQKKKIR